MTKLSCFNYKGCFKGCFKGFIKNKSLACVECGSKKSNNILEHQYVPYYECTYCFSAASINVIDI